MQYFYWTLHRFYHLARYNIGLSPLLNGTGFMVRFDVVKPNGWDTQTLTEDIEFSLKRIIAGKRLGWATDAIVYDEQPVGFKQSWSQRSRWTVGHIQCMHKYTKDLAMAAKKNKTLMNFDGLIIYYRKYTNVCNNINIIINKLCNICWNWNVSSRVNMESCKICSTNIFLTNTYRNN